MPLPLSVFLSVKWARSSQTHPKGEASTSYVVSAHQMSPTTVALPTAVKVTTVLGGVGGGVAGQGPRVIQRTRGYGGSASQSGILAGVG